MNNKRIVWCEFCQSEGRILTSDGGPDDKDHGQCPHCEGTGSHHGRGTNMNTQLNWLKWKSNILKDPWSVTGDGTSYMVSSYNHGTEIIVTGDDPKGNNFLYQDVDTVEAGKAVAQASEDQRRS